jgi:Zn-dependent protease with chaperone function
MTAELLVANLLHGLVAMIWLAGIRRFAGPIPPALNASLLMLALVLPVFVAALHLTGVAGPPEGLKLLRVDLWSMALVGSGAFYGFVLALVIGTMVIVLLQELWPAWRRKRGPLRAERVEDPRLVASLARVRESYAAIGTRFPRRRQPRARVLETAQDLALLHGLRAPTVLVSRGLLDRLDDEELDGVIAHELAHLVRGGNLRLLAIWGVRLLQAASPPALILFRSFVEAQESACDALAANASRRPAALAHALVKVYGRAPSPGNGAGALDRARAEIQRRSDLTSTRLRVRALLDHEPNGRVSLAAVLASAVALGGMLWAIQ